MAQRLLVESNEQTAYKVPDSQVVKFLPSGTARGQHDFNSELIKLTQITSDLSSCNLALFALA